MAHDQASRPTGAIHPVLSRRTFLFDLGTAVAAAVTLGACTSSADPSSGPAGSASPGVGASGAASGPSSPSAVDPTAAGDQLQWERVLGGAASAYVLVRAGEATIVDTGQPGAAPALEDGLAALGVGWADVADVVLTHRHPDHVGGLGEVAELAADATLSAGTGDLEAITAAREVVGIGNGDRIMGLEVYETPGHTPGHVSVFDPGTGVLVAGDALNGTEDERVAGPNPDFTPDMDTAWASARTLASLQPAVVLFGHGPPATDDPTAALEALLADAGVDG